MTRHARVGGTTPFVARDMQIGMTYPAEKNLDLHIARLRIAAVLRDYSMTDRAEAPEDSRAFHKR